MARGARSAQRSYSAAREQFIDRLHGRMHIENSDSHLRVSWLFGIGCSDPEGARTGGVLSRARHRAVSGFPANGPHCGHGRCATVVSTWGVTTSWVHRILKIRKMHTGAESGLRLRHAGTIPPYRIGSIPTVGESSRRAGTSVYLISRLRASRGIGSSMSHTKTEKQKLLTRIRRVRGQLEAVERTVETEAECAAILQQITACRGALDALVAEVVEHHIRKHVVDPSAPGNDPRSQAAEQLVEIVHSYLT